MRVTFAKPEANLRLDEGLCATPALCFFSSRKYGGPKEHIPLWAQNIGLDFLRRQLITGIENDEIGE